MNPVQESTWPPALGPGDPPIDFSRELAAYNRERDRLVRDHLGKLALVYQDEVIGVFDSPDDAILEGGRRFGLVRMMLQEIRDPNDPPDFISLVDPHHPSFRRIG